MEPNPERITWLTFIGWLVLALVVAMFAAPIALWVGAAGRPTVIRIACRQVSYIQSGCRVA